MNEDVFGADCLACQDTGMVLDCGLLNVEVQCVGRCNSDPNKPMTCVYHRIFSNVDPPVPLPCWRSCRGCSSCTCNVSHGTVGE